ncbi:M23 family metallopeptidase [Streptomyces naganishii]|uniref:Peptidase n=1 Tax=Streptomyces naganishii JCM 4654 TaxID=1306179 RepID=A0A918Y2S2_9ACTN|nr:peptidoglycan DD-metalloendopeptidase family protein [Streptomyces naganishii]GHD87731.1 peptidase [Streptomyces naganishii JCM 4654]
MPAKGKHRRPKAQRLTRTIAAAGTGGAALALPLVSAAGAHAAPAKPAPQSAVRATPASGKGAAAGEGVRTYTVRPGDCLSKIAGAQHVRGGWHRLYADNRQAVGDDPSLIHPGLKLRLDGAAAATGATTAPKSSAAPGHTDAARPAAAGSAAKPAEAPRSAASTSTGFTLPVSGAAIGTGYHVAGSMWSSGYHTGVDFVVPTGTPVKAVGAGTVVSAGWGGAYGNQVVIRLADGHYAQYGHLSALSVSAGQSVTEGQRVGLSGATGNVTGPHLHFEIRTSPDYGSDVDPVAYLRSHGVAV